MKCICVKFSMRTKSELNQREHWVKKYRRTKLQKDTTKAVLMTFTQNTDFGTGKITVTFVRIAKRKIDKGDNLASAFKAVRDAVAMLIGVDDGSDRYEWIYEQRIERNRLDMVEIKIEW